MIKKRGGLVHVASLHCMLLRDQCNTLRVNQFREFIFILNIGL